jgi:hypothetical protein
VLLTRGRVAKPPLSWRTVDGPLFGNAISTLTLEGRQARLLMEFSGSLAGSETLQAVVVRDLSG